MEFDHSRQSGMNSDNNNDNDGTLLHSLASSTVTSPPTHPLLIPHVIRSILEYLSVNAIQSNRAVCIDWNHEACLVLQRQPHTDTTATFLNETDINGYLDIFGESPPTLPPLHSSYQLYNGVRFTELTDSWGNQPPVPTPLHHFLRSQGGHIRTLILQQQTPPILEKELYWALENHLPVLESLSLRYIPLQPSTEPPSSSLLHKHHCFYTIKNLTVGTESFHGRRPGRRSYRKPKSWDECNQRAYPFYDHHPRLATRNWLGDVDSIRAVLINFLGSVPNLESVSISTLTLGAVEDGFLEPTCSRFAAVMALKEASESILKALSLVPPERLSKHLKALNFPLHVDSEETLAGVSRILTSTCSHASTSRSCPLGRGVGQVMLEINLQTSETAVVKGMGQLLHMLAQCSFVRRVSFSVPQPHIWTAFEEQLTWTPKLLPSLDTLKICRVQSSSEFPHGWQYHPNECETIRRMAIAFPHLCVLQIYGANDDALRLVYAQFPNLTRFAVTQGRFTDAGVTGVPLELCAEITNVASIDADTAVQLRSNLFIGNLSKLRDLHLDSDHMTSLSISWGILRCDVLEYLELRSSQVDTETVALIVREIGDGGTGSPLRLLKTLDVRDCHDIFTFLIQFPARVQGHLLVLKSGSGDCPRLRCLEWENKDREALVRRVRKHVRIKKFLMWAPGRLSTYYY